MIENTVKCQNCAHYNDFFLAGAGCNLAAKCSLDLLNDKEALPCSERPCYIPKKDCDLVTFAKAENEWAEPCVVAQKVYDVQKLSRCTERRDIKGNLLFQYDLVFDKESEVPDSLYLIDWNPKRCSFEAVCLRDVEKSLPDLSNLEKFEIVGNVMDRTISIDWDVLATVLNSACDKNREKCSSCPYWETCRDGDGSSRKAFIDRFLELNHILKGETL